MREYAALPHEYLGEMEMLSDEEFGRLIRALLRLSMTGEVSELTGNEKFFWKRVVNRETRYQESFEETHEKRSRAGRKGAQARWGTREDGPAMGCDGPDGKTEAETHSKTNTKTKSNSNSKALPSTDGRSAAYDRSVGEQIRRDCLWLEEFSEKVKKESEDLSVNQEPAGGPTPSTWPADIRIV